MGADAVHVVSAAKMLFLCVFRKLVSKSLKNYIIMQIEFD